MGRFEVAARLAVNCSNNDCVRMLGGYELVSEGRNNFCCSGDSFG